MPQSINLSVRHLLLVVKHPLSTTSTIEIDKTPIDIYDDCWDKEGDSKAWPYCPPNIPDRWRQWWFRPACGAAHSRIRYNVSLPTIDHHNIAVPYETLDDFRSRCRLSNQAKEHRDQAISNWHESQRLYEPWRPVEGEMVVAAPDLFNDADRARMKSLWWRGAIWPQICLQFPWCPKDAFVAEYFRLVADGFGSRVIGCDDTQAAWDKLQSANKLDYIGAQWTRDEEAVILKLREYGLTWIAISEELERRGP